MADDEKKAGGGNRARKQGKRPPRAGTGELWAKCPECRMPVKDEKLFVHLLKCPGADVRQAEWKAQEAKKAATAQPNPEAQAQ